MGIFELPNMMNPDGTSGNIIVAFAGIAITMAVAFILTMLFYKEKEPVSVSIDSSTDSDTVSDPVSAAASGTISIASPLKGRLIKLSDVQDEAFSSGVLGKGVAVLPEEGALYAPADGTISAFFPTGHAVGMTTEDGAELLIHVGMDTVQLDGKGFTPLVKVNDKVKKGQKLLEFDISLIQNAGYSLVTPVLVANTDDYADVTSADAESISQGEELLTIVR